jgi:predicted RNA-binding Zn ribbon-like protein
MPVVVGGPARHTEDVTTEVRNPSVAPGDLELVRAFVNTLDIEAGTDDLGTPSSSAAWLEAYGWPTRVDRSEHEELVRAREALRDLVSARGTSGEPRAIEAIDAIARRYPIIVQVSSPSALAPSARGGVVAFVERIFGLVAAARIDGSWKRMKTCANGGCRWLFYDHSRNRSRTWCTMDLCGSQAKMRAYRRRRVAADHPAERERTA